MLYCKFILCVPKHFSRLSNDFLVSIYFERKIPHLSWISHDESLLVQKQTQHCLAFCLRFKYIFVFVSLVELTTCLCKQFTNITVFFFFFCKAVTFTNWKMCFQSGGKENYVFWQDEKTFHPQPQSSPPPNFIQTANENKTLAQQT